MWIGVVIDTSGLLPRVTCQFLKGPSTAEARAAMSSTRAWLTLSELIGWALPMERILDLVRGFDRAEAVFTLATIAAELANSEHGLLSAAARSWTHDLLVQRTDAEHPLERKVSRALKVRGTSSAIAHGRVVHTLVQLVLAHSPDNGKAPHDGLLAFLMLALNDHIPRWDDGELLPHSEAVFAAICAESVFNQTFDDPLRSLVRLASIFDGQPERGQVSPQQWLMLQEGAFGCSFREYLELYLAPLHILSRGWNSESRPIIFKEPWLGSSKPELYERWFALATVSLSDAASTFARDLWPDGLPKPSREFVETPFIESENRLIAMSPWHLRAHASLGTWAKLNTATKLQFGQKNGNQIFSATFGILFEQWSHKVAREAAADARFEGRLIVPTSPGTDEEIEDIVVVDAGRVALFSVKAAIVRAESLKAARSLQDILDWLTRFFVEDRESARTRRQRQGSLRLLDEKVAKLRAGEYEHAGLHRDSTIFPVVVTYDHLPVAGLTYKWLAERAQALQILTVPGVRPVTLLNPAELEALFALAARGQSVCDLLDLKTQSPEHLKPMDVFLASRCQEARELRLPSMEAEFAEILTASVARLKEIGVFAPDAIP